MRIGIPREIKLDEHRVAATPATVREFLAQGHEVFVEKDAGVGLSLTDEAYQSAGATVLDTADEIFDRAQMIVKVKEPQSSEWKRLRSDHILFTFLHLAVDPEQARGLMSSGCTAVAYETVTDRDGRLPLLAPMSEVAGRIAIEAAAFSLRRVTGGMGKLLGGVPGVSPATVAIVGGGVVGTQAARIAAGMGAEVVVLDHSVPRLRELDEMFKGRIRTRYSTRDAVEEECFSSDVVIGAVLVPGASAPKIVTRSQLKQFRSGCVLVDVAIDQGGCFETSRPTTHRDPTYSVDGVIHYCVANMPGAVPITSSHALNNATLPFALTLANKGMSAFEDPNLRDGLNVHAGRVTNRTVAESLNLEFDDMMRHH